MSFQRLNGITSATSTEQGEQLIKPLSGAGTLPPQATPTSGAGSAIPNGNPAHSGPPMPQPSQMGTLTDNSTSRLTGLGGSQQPPPMSQQMMNTVQRPGGNPFGLQVPPQLVQTVVQRIMTGFPTSVSLERTPDVEQMLAGRFMAALTGVPGNLPPGGQEALFLAVMDEILGFGPLEPFLQDDSITEIMVNGPDQVWVERKGHPSETGVKFLNEEHVMRVAQRVVAPLGRKLDRQWPMVDARLPDGSRVNIITTPCALQGTTITIRKFFKTPLTVERLIEFGTISAQMAEFLRACVIGKLNIVVAGGTGSGKTTLLNVLSSFIPEGQRILTIEDSAELRLNQRHVVSLEARPADSDGNSAVRIRDLVVNSLRMRPERIVVGEVRGGEALDMLQAMNTGHDGSLTTLHANTPRDALSRLETMVLMAGMELPIRAIREQVASAIDLIVQQARLRDGSRKITYITEVQGMEGEQIVLQDIFRFREVSNDIEGKVTGRLEPTGLVPKFLTRLETEGQRVERSLFMPR